MPHIGWPGAAQVARIWRQRRIGDKVATEVACIVTSLDAAAAPPARLRARVARPLAHRELPASCPRHVDGRGPLPRAAGGRALVRLRNLALVTIRRRGLDVREARENFREDRAEAIAAVTGRFFE